MGFSVKGASDKMMAGKGDPGADTAPEHSPPVKSAKAREIWITGVATPRAKQKLNAKGFAVVERQPVR